MASHAVDSAAKHNVTLVADTVDTFTFKYNIATVEIISDGTADVYYTVDGSTPTVGGENCYKIPGTGGVVMDVRAMPKVSDVVKMISAGAPVVSVQRG